jgi:apolipoprotein N-acyltransferase
VTAIVAPDGSIVKKAPMFKKTVLTGRIFPMGGMTPYARLGDGIITFLIGLCFLLLLVYPKKIS